MTAIGEEPKKLLLRRRDILRWTGISAYEFDQVASAEPTILPHRAFRPGGKRYYLKDDVSRVFFRQFKQGK